MNVTRKLKTLAVAAVAGGLTAYYFDPAAGRRRRDKLAATVERRSADARHLVHSAERIKAAVRPDDEPTSTKPATHDAPAVPGVTDTDQRSA